MKKASDKAGGPSASSRDSVAVPTAAGREALTGRHTPGPWFVGERGRNSAGIEIGPRYRDGYGINSIAYVEDEAHEDLSLDEEDANAALIAAAPNLLEALEQIVLDLEDEDCGVPVSEMVKTARVAIAKARGGAP